MEFITLQGKSIKLRELREGDAESIMKNCDDMSIAKVTLAVPHPYTLKHAEEFIQISREKWREDEGYAFGIEYEGDVVGTIEINMNGKEHDRATIGYWLGKQYRQQGIMGEALDIIIKFAFEKLGLNKVDANVFVGNEASEALLNSRNFKYEGILREHSKRFGEYKDEKSYSLLEKEYRARFKKG